MLRYLAHRLGDDEAGEQEPEAVGEGGDDSSHLGVGRYADGQHAIEGEEGQVEDQEQQIPEKLACKTTTIAEVSVPPYSGWMQL